MSLNNGETVNFQTANGGYEVPVILKDAHMADFLVDIMTVGGKPDADAETIMVAPDVRPEQLASFLAHATGEFDEA